VDSVSRYGYSVVFFILEFISNTHRFNEVISTSSTFLVHKELTLLKIKNPNLKIELVFGVRTKLSNC